ncbi:MAG: hypothetical protein ACREXT_18240 [Gammaproteobacteria bacterium]
MAAIQTIVLQRIRPESLAIMPPRDWERFAAGGAPLAPGNRKVDLLLITLRGGVCEEADPITLDLDENGYLVRIDVAVQPLPDHPALFDARSAFIGRYLKHAHHWRPSERLIRHALDLISATRRGDFVLS